MNKALNKNEFDAIIIGSGAGGATIARELSKQNKKVLILERGANTPLRETFWGLGSIANEVAVSDKLKSMRAITTGGSTAIYAAMAELPHLDTFMSLGIDLSRELEEVKAELPLSVLPDEVLGPQALKLRESALQLGYAWNKNLMIVDESKCTSGYSYEAKWNARSFVADAVNNGAVLLNKTTVLQILVEKNQAVGVEYKLQKEFSSEICTAYGTKIILAAGVLASPNILQKSGIKNIGNKGFYCNPGFLMFGYARELKGVDNFVGSMSADLGDGIVIGDANLTRTFYQLIMLGTFKWSRVLSHTKSMAVGGLIKDSLGGELTKDGKYYKKLTDAELKKLKKAEQAARKVLENAGAKNIFCSSIDAGNVGGVIRIQEHVDERLQTDYKNLYVCDGSIVPEGMRLHPTVTLVCLGKYLAKHISNSL